MSAHPVFGARLVAVVSLGSVLMLAGCSRGTGGAAADASSASGATSAAPMETMSQATASAVVPVVANITSPTSKLVVDCDAFAAQPKGSATVHLKAGDVMAVTLCTNASTGFSWEPPVIVGDGLSVSGASTGMPASSAADADATVPPLGAAPTNVVGAASTTTFLLTAQRAGTTTVSFSYSRPWVGGEKGVWEYTLHVTID